MGKGNHLTPFAENPTTDQGNQFRPRDFLPAVLSTPLASIAGPPERLLSASEMKHRLCCHVVSRLECHRPLLLEQVVPVKSSYVLSLLTCCAQFARLGLSAIAPFSTHCLISVAIVRDTDDSCCCSPVLPLLPLAEKCHCRIRLAAPVDDG